MKKRLLIFSCFFLPVANCLLPTAVCFSQPPNWDSVYADYFKKYQPLDTPAWVCPNKVSIISALLFRLSLLINIGLLIHIQAVAQCVADAGKDKIYCYIPTIFDSVYLGGSQTANGGIPPYTYTWEINIDTSGLIKFPAAYYLNDTTVSNPLIVKSGDGEMTFHLTVSDSIGNICSDSITVLFSNAGINLVDKYAYIFQGDSVILFPGVGGAIPPLIYQWTPNYNLSNPNSPGPLAFPDTTTYYLLSITDSVGCQFTDPDIFEVYVTPVGIKDINAHNAKIEILPNPFSDLTIIKISCNDPHLLKLELLDQLGRTLKSYSFMQRELKIEKGELNAGIYFYRLLNNRNLILGQGKLVIL